MTVNAFVREDLPPEEIERQQALYGPFTQALRELVDAGIRTEVDDEEIRRAQAEVEAITARLRARQLPGSFGVRYDGQGRGRPWGNAVVGLRNAVAPPLQIEHDESRNGDVWCEATLGAAYEGPPGMVHGGVLSLVLDQLLGESAGAGGKPGMTGTLTITYRRPTPLGPVSLRGWIERFEEYKTWAKGQLSTADGVTVEAEGVFILPKWAREMQAERAGSTPKFFE